MALGRSRGAALKVCCRRESLACSLNHWRAGLPGPEGLCSHQGAEAGNRLKHMFLVSGLNVAPAVQVTFASCGSLIQCSQSSASLAFAWVSHSHGISLLDLNSRPNLQSAFLSRVSISPFPWDCTWLPVSLTPTPICPQICDSGLRFQPSPASACVVSSQPLRLQELDMGSSLEIFLVWILIIIAVSFDVNTIKPYSYCLYSKSKSAPFTLTCSSKDTLINSVVEIVTKCSKIMFYSWHWT